MESVAVDVWECLAPLADALFICETHGRYVGADGMSHQAQYATHPTYLRVASNNAMSKRAFSFISNFLPIYSIMVEPLANTALGWANLAMFFSEVYSANMPIHFLGHLNMCAINNLLFDRLEHADFDILTDETWSHGEADKHSPSLQAHTHTHTHCIPYTVV